MGFDTLADVVKSTVFENLSPEAKQLAFDKYSAKDQSFQSLSPEAQQLAREKYVGVAEGGKTPAGTQRSEGMTPVTETEGGAALMAPTSRRKEVPVAEQTFGQDPARVGSVKASEYVKNIAEGAGAGAVVGGAIGAFTGPGMIATGFTGAVLGAASGLAESVAKDLGYGKGTQLLAGTVAGFGTPAGTSQQLKGLLGNTVESFIAKQVAGKLAYSATGIPGSGVATKGLIGKAGQFIKESRGVDTKAAQKALGEVEQINPVTGEVEKVLVEPKTAGVAQTTNRDAAAQELADLHPDVAVTGDKPISHSLYENAKQAYDTVGFPKRGGLGGDNFLSSPQFKDLAEGIPAQETKFGQLFQNEKGQALVGEDVINNLNNATAKMSYKDAEKVKKAFNEYLIEQGQFKVINGKKVGVEEVARKAYEKEAIAKAQDMLPGMLLGNDGKAINDQLWNLSKVPNGNKVFKEELLHYLDNTNVKNAKMLWNDIGPNVKKRFNMSDKQYTDFTDVINGAQTAKELSNARRILMRVTVPIVSAPSQEEE